MAYQFTLGKQNYLFDDLKSVLAKASPLRSGDALAGLAAASNTERIAAQYVLSELPLKVFLNEAVVPYELDEVTRLIIDTHDVQAFDNISHFIKAFKSKYELTPKQLILTKEKSLTEMYHS